MPLPFPDHPLRHAVTQELHVRAFEPVRPPVSVAHFAYQCGERGSGVNVAHLLRLQETVEGLSVVAISYYGLGLVGYLLKAIEAGGLWLDATLATALALPLVPGAVWFGLKRTRKRLHRDAAGASQDGAGDRGG